jgi:hypothetical protein
MGRDVLWHPQIGPICNLKLLYGAHFSRSRRFMAPPDGTSQGALWYPRWDHLEPLGCFMAPPNGTSQGALWHPQMGPFGTSQGALWHPHIWSLKVLCGTPRWNHLEPHMALYGTPYLISQGALWHPQMGPFGTSRVLYSTPRWDLSRYLVAPPDGTNLEPLKVLCGTPRWDQFGASQGALWHPQMGPAWNLSRFFMAPSDGTHFEPPRVPYVKYKVPVARVPFWHPG